MSADQYAYVPHHLLRRRVRDIASGVEGELMTVINENVSESPLHEHWVELAYIRAANGREFTTAAANVQPTYDQPETSGSRRDGGSA
ncbi:hypothetical protein [Streptomyces sp. NPDC001436]